MRDAEPRVGAEGGDVPHDVQVRIDASRGGGRPVDRSVSERVGTALGTDLERVRVHTDAAADTLNRTLSATAFTTGNDIFFSRGSYRPGSRRGDELIAHELTHVAQQQAGGGMPTRMRLTVGPAGDRHEQEADRIARRIIGATGPVGDLSEVALPSGASPAARRRIQRSVGYEFETNFKVERANKGLKGLSKGYRPMRKMEVIKAYPEGFRMEADENSTLGSTIEFVVDPPVAETNGNGLERILQKLDAVAHTIAGATNQVPVALDTLTGDPAHAGVRVTAQGPLTANPQVTGGISFEKLITLLSEMGGGSNTAPLGHQQAAGELETMAPQMPLQAAARGASVLGTAPFKALVAFTSSYIKFAQKINPTYPPLNYAKLMSNSVLVRTDFGSMFKKLDPDEREEYENDPDTFVNLVMGVAAPVTASADVPVIERGVRKGYTPGTKAYTQLVNSPVTTLTRRQWLSGITRGVDLLSSHHMAALKSQLEGLGALGPTTDKVAGEAAPAHPLGAKDRGSGIVVEFRNMRKNVAWDRWHGLAADIFDYIVELNQRA